MSPKKHDDLKTSVADAGNWGDGTRVQFLYKGGPQMVPSCSGMQRLTTPLVQHPETPAHPTARSASRPPSPHPSSRFSPVAFLETMRVSPSLSTPYHGSGWQCTRHPSAARPVPGTCRQSSVRLVTPGCLIWISVSNHWPFSKQMLGGKKRQVLIHLDLD